MEKTVFKKLRMAVKPKLSQAKLASRINVSQSTISRAERGVMDFETQTALAEYFNRPDLKPVLKFKSQNNYTPANVAGKSRKR